MNLSITWQHEGFMIISWRGDKRNMGMKMMDEDEKIGS